MILKKEAAAQPGEVKQRPTRKSTESSLSNSHIAGKLTAFDAATRYLQAKLSVIPIKANGSKSPTVKWQTFQNRLATPEELEEWFGNGREFGVAIIGGNVSGGLTIIDFDDPSLYEPWRALVEIEAPGLLDRLSVISTPSDGRHVYFRASQSEGNQKLAESEKGETLIETRGEGGYVLAPGSPANCHPANKLYTHVGGPTLGEVLEISAAERQTLLDLARSFNKRFKVVTGQSKPSRKSGGNRPGDKFNATANWEDILPKHGWKSTPGPDGKTFWTRPGKKAGCSATTGFCTNGDGGDLLYVFSSNASPFEPRTAYTKFAAFTFLNHDGDFTAAAKALASSNNDMSGDVADGSLPSRLVQLVKGTPGVELFADPECRAYATVPIFNSYRTETISIRSRAFHRWLQQFAFNEGIRSVSELAASTVAHSLEAIATYGNKLRVPVFTRIGSSPDGAIWLDLANDKGEAVRIDGRGWKIVPNPAVKFVRRRGQSPLPRPVKGGTLNSLRSLCNVPKDGWPLLLGFIVGSFRPTGSYPILVVYGEQGSAKSTLGEMVRALIDPHAAPLRSAPKKEHDLMIAANNNWLLVFDNLSHVSVEMSDCLCRLSTGGAFSTRLLYTDDEEFVLSAMRPSIINGIEEVATRSDLLDRSLILELPTIPPEKRRPAKELWEEFARVHSKLLGKLLDAVSAALKRSRTLRLKNLPRMADFAKFVISAEPALGLKSGSFLKAYQNNQSEAHDLAIESTPVGAFVIELANEGWDGTATELLKKLRLRTIGIPRDTPRNPRALSGVLKRLAPNLRACGIHVESYRKPGGQRQRRISIRRIGKTMRPVASHQSGKTKRSSKSWDATGRKFKRLKPK